MDNTHSVFVHVVTFNNEKTIVPCLSSLISQEGFSLGKDLFVQVTDNASSDNTASLIDKEFAGKITLIRNKSNTGFSRAHNDGLSIGCQQSADYLFVANPDLLLEPSALKDLVRALESDSRAGVACPKLYRANEDLALSLPKRFDTTGMFITPSIRHFDRGSQELDATQYEAEQYVFGASGAACLLRREFVEDVALPTGKTSNIEIELFDNSFFAYREDADLSWRAQWLGWRCRYVPSASGRHTRVVLPEKRSELSPNLNALGVQNRFLLQLNNFSLLQLRCLIPGAFRNLLVLAAVLTFETSSLPALKNLINRVPRALEIRSWIKRKRRVPAFQINRWFRSKPYSEPALLEQASERPIRSLCIVVINYNSGSRLGNALRTISQALVELRETIQIKVRIIDNASSDPSASRVKPMFDSFTEFDFSFLKENLGFAGGIEKAVENDSSDALLVLNPDIEISASAVNELIKSLNNYRALAAVTPVLCDPDGTPQHGFIARGLPTLASTLCELYYFHRLFPNNPWTSAYHLSQDTFLRNYISNTLGGKEVPHENLEKPLLVPQPAGASLMIRREAYDQLDGFDTSFWPAWFEDVDFCKRLWEKDWQCAVVSKARVTHEGGYSVEALGQEKFFEIWYGNLLRYWKKHGTKAEYFTLRGLIVPALLLRGLVHLVRSLSPSESSRDSAANDRRASLALIRLALGL